MRIELKAVTAEGTAVALNNLFKQFVTDTIVSTVEVAQKQGKIPVENRDWDWIGDRAPIQMVEKGIIWAWNSTNNSSSATGECFICFDNLPVDPKKVGTECLTLEQDGCMVDLTVVIS